MTKGNGDKDLGLTFSSPLFFHALIESLLDFFPSNPSGCHALPLIASLKLPIFLPTNVKLQVIAKALVILRFMLLPNLYFYIRDIDILAPCEVEISTLLNKETLL